MTTYPITFTVGDWSGDGHEQSESFLVHSSIPVEELREVHFLAPAEVGFDIGTMCKEYNDSSLVGFYDHLVEIGILSADDPLFSEEEDEAASPEDIIDIWLGLLRHIAQARGIPLTLTRVVPGTALALPVDELAALAKKARKSLGLELEVSVHGEAAEDPVRALFEALNAAAQARGQTLTVSVTGGPKRDVPTFHFYGYDAKRRHLNVPGYGVFVD